MNDIDFNKLYFKYKQRIYATCYKMHPTYAADLTQEVFIKIFQNADKFDYQCKLATWIYRVTVNTVINALRKDRSITANEFYDDCQYVGAFAPTRNPLSQLEIDEKQELIKKAISTLPATLKDAAILRYIYGYRRSEISERLNCSSGLIATRLHRVQKKLTEKLEKYA